MSWSKVNPSIGWILHGDINTGSARIHGLNIHNHLVKAGCDSRIIQSLAPASYELRLTKTEKLKTLLSPLDIIIFQKVIDAKATRFAHACKLLRKKTILIHCDLVETPLINIADHIVTASQELKSQLDERFGINANVIPDAIEVPETCIKIHSETPRIKVLWVGHSDNWGTLDILHETLSDSFFSDFELITISNHPEATYPWDLATIYKLSLTGDIGVIPSFDTSWHKSKSNNRLTFLMGMGLPTICSPVPAYVDLVENGVNGYVARNTTEWRHCLSLLRDHNLRKKIGNKAREDARRKFGIAAIGKQWKEYLQKIHNA